MPARLPSHDAMLRAFLASDPAAEGIFLTGVKTTGIFCRPTCKARKPLPQNVTFFGSASDALHAGFRPCKLCRPMDAVTPPPPLVLRLRDAIEADPSGRLSEKDLAALGIEPTTARRQFRRYYGMTFHAYARARRMGLALRDVQSGHSVTDTQLARGFESASGFREAFVRLFGVSPRAAGNDQRVLFVERIETPLGSLLAIADDAGLHVLDFVDRRGLERKLQTLRRQLGATVVPGAHAHIATTRAQIDEYFAGGRTDFDLPLVPRGTSWEKAAWAYLQKIPFATTTSYGAMAEALGRAAAARAVGRANGLNFLAIVIPCHRVIRADGALCGYGGGLWRKQWLLDHERRHAVTV